MRKLSITAAILFCSMATPALCAPPMPSEERTWTGVNGKSFVGIFHSTFDEGGKKVRFVGQADKIITVALDNLSEADRELVLLFKKKAFQDPSKPAFPGAYQSEFFKKLPIADRKKIPPLESEEIATVEYESIVDAVWVSLL